MHSRMTGGSSLPNPRLAMPVFIIPPEWYSGSMAFSNRCQREVRILRKVSSRSFPACHFVSYDFLLVLVMAVIGTIK